MKPTLLGPLVAIVLAGCAAHDEVRLDVDPPTLRYRARGQLGWSEVEVRCAEGVPPPRFAAPRGASTVAFVGWTDGAPTSRLVVGLEDRLVLTAGGRPLFLRDGDAVLLLADGQALRLAYPDEQATHERYVGRISDGGVVELDVWFASETKDATLSPRFEGVHGMALAEPRDGPVIMTSHISFSGGRPTLLETSAPGLSIRLNLDTRPLTAELVLGDRPPTHVTLDRLP